MSLKKFRRGRTWYLRGTVNGVSVYETTGTSDQTQAERARAQREAQLWERVRFGERGTHTFGEAVLIYLQARNPGQSFRDTLGRLVEHFEQWPLEQLTQAAIDRYVAQQHPRAMPGTVIKAVITPMTAVLRAAAKRGWCEIPAFERPRVVKPKTCCLSDDEAKALVKACAPHLRPLILFLLNTGARLGEALNLQWTEVDLQRRRVVFVDTKNGESRGVPLNADAFVALANLPCRDDQVFLTPAGKPYYNSGGRGGSPIKTAFRGALRRAGLRNIRVHDLRHTFASKLVMNGVPLRTVAELLGHKDLSMVHRYSHLSPDHLRDAVDGLIGAESVQRSARR